MSPSAASRRCTLIAPQWSGPSRVSRPGFKAMNVAVARGADGRRLRDAGVGIEPARHVERQDRYAAVIGLSDPARMHAVDRARESDAEQTVDDEAEVAIAAPVRYDRHRRARRHAARAAAASAGMRAAPSQRADDDVEKPRAQGAARRRTRRRRCCPVPASTSTRARRSAEHVARERRQRQSPARSISGCPAIRVSMARMSATRQIGSERIG